jgi:hypothetical protein
MPLSIGEAEALALQPGELHLEFFEPSHRFVILRSAATKDLRLLFGLFPARRHRFGMVALQKPSPQRRGKTTADPSLRSG